LDKGNCPVEWYFVFLIMMILLFGLFLSGLPVAFAFIVLNFAAICLWMGGTKGFILVVKSAFQILNTFILTPIPLFIIMGTIIFHSGAARVVIDALDRWIGHIPGRLSILAVAVGTVFAAVSGVPMGTTAMLGSLFVPEMRRREYSKQMSLGPILGGGGLALIIPPSAMAVLLGGIAEVSIGHLLIACVVPGLALASLYIAYILFQCIRHPESAPKYAGKQFSFRERIISLRYILPLAGIIFLVTGIIFLGIATPTEAAAAGALGAFIWVATSRKLSWSVFKKTLTSSVQVTVMVMMIIIGSVAFCHVLAYTGCTHGLARFAAGLTLPPILMVVAMQVVIIILGCFMDLISLTMITVPIFMPVVNALGLNPVWFCTMMLINLGAATLTPPFGMLLFTMKGVVPDDVSMGDIILAAVPYFLMNLAVIGLVLIFPSIALWLPSRMK
jgi:tripartite ATP-independent transporter DctM subunit